MTIENFGIIAGYGLWCYILLCMWVKTGADRSRNHRTAVSARRIRALFRPAGDVRRPLPGHRLHRCARSEVLLELMAECYARNCGSYESAEKTMFENLLRSILLEQLVTADCSDPLIRCTLLRCIYLTRVRHPQLEHFVSACAGGSPLERMWVQKLREAPGPTAGAAPGEKEAEGICS